MQQVFIELYKYRLEWLALSKDERQKFVDFVAAAVEKSVGAGLKIVGWGANSQKTDHRAPYDFYCVYMTPSEEFTRSLEAEISGSPWHSYFEQVQVSGDVLSPKDALAILVAGDRP